MVADDTLDILDARLVETGTDRRRDLLSREGDVDRAAHERRLRRKANERPLAVSYTHLLAMPLSTSAMVVASSELLRKNLGEMSY